MTALKDLDAIDKKLAEKTFAGWKLDMEKAMMVDHRLTTNAYKVASCLLQFMNGNDGRIFPSIEAIAETTGMKDRAARYALALLKETGWLDWHRGNRRLANEYYFNIDNLAPMLAVRRQIESNRGKRKTQRRSTSYDRHEVATRTGSLPSPTGNTVPTNTLREDTAKRASK